MQVWPAVEPSVDGLAYSEGAGAALGFEGDAAAVQVSHGAPEDAFQTLCWEINTDRHPMEVDGEREFIEGCLRQLAAMLRQHGGVLGYRDSLKEISDQELDKGPFETLRRALEATLQKQARTSGDCVFVQNGWVISMGNKKVVKLFASESVECEGKLSVCWNWDVKLEPRQ